MNETTKTGLHIVLVFNLIFVAGMATLIWKHAPQMLTKQTIAPFGVLIFFASMFAWQDSIQFGIVR